MNTIKIGHITEIPRVIYSGQPVVTLAMVDQVHQRPTGTASRNYKANKQRFIDGEDYYLVDFNKKDEFRPFGIEVPTRGLIVFTESGYLLLVKSFTDDLAWNIQRQLIKSYFRSKEQVMQPEQQVCSADCTCLTIAIGGLTTTLENLTTQLATSNTPTQQRNLSAPQRLVSALPFLNAW